MDQDNKPAEENSQQNEPAQQQSKPMGRHDESAKADVPVFKPTGRPWVLRTFIIVIMVLLLVLAGLFGWLWWQERNDDENGTSTQTAQESSQENTSSTCPENFGIYANEGLGVEFCYPDAWGEPQAHDAKFTETDNGQRWHIGFSDKEQVNMGLVSDDWSTTAGRELTCVDPATQTLPAFTPFSIDWNVETTIDTADPQPSSAVRGVEKEDGKFIIEERVDDLLTNGACIAGYTIIDNETYPFATSTYYYGPLDDVSVQMYMDNPENYVSPTERADFATFVKSIKAYGG